MLKTLTLAVLLAAGLTTTASAQSFLGQWTATAKSPGGESSETLTVTRTANGYAVAAKPVVAPPAGVEAGPGEEVTLDGNNFAYTRKIGMQGGAAIQITYKGVVSGDTFAGTASLGGVDIPYTGVRVAGTK